MPTATKPKSVPQFYHDRRPTASPPSPDLLTPSTIGDSVERAIKRALVTLMIKAIVGILAATIILSAAALAVRSS